MCPMNMACLEYTSHVSNEYVKYSNECVTSLTTCFNCVRANMQVFFGILFEMVAGAMKGKQKAH